MTSCHQWSRPSRIGTGSPVRRTTITLRTPGAPATASSTASFSGSAFPRRKPPSAVTTIWAPTSISRSRSDSAEKPPKTTLWGAPMRVHASMAMASSGIIGM